jgi:(+)-trans-carveol dehydrogenase
MSAGRLAGKVAVISGAARGQGRAHAVALAREGASIVAFDVCKAMRSPLHPSADEADLEETAHLVHQEGGRCITASQDARDLAGLTALADRAMRELGRVDVLVVNHGIWAVNESAITLEEEEWQESIDILLTGAWKVAKAFLPKVLDAKRGGSVIFNASILAGHAHPSSTAYTAAKHGVLGLMRTLAWQLGPESVRVNALMPGAISTPMSTQGESITLSSQWHPRFYATDRSLLPVEWIPPESVAKAVVFLACDDSEHITGITLPVDAGWTTF